MKKNERIHSRNIAIDCYETPEGNLFVEASLADERYVPFFLYTANRVHDPGVIHGMIARMTLSVPDLTILDAEAEMPHVPIAECTEARNSIRRLIGMRIRSGFTNEVRLLLGKRAGCQHLTNLIMTMSSGAVQGLWTIMSRLREKESGLRQHLDPDLLLDSCWLWRSDGPLAERLRQAREREKGEAEEASGKPL
ncbi:MAG: DUF2889 domain-containing protein [Syntrophales bacterium]